MPHPSSTIVEPRLACRSGKQNDPIECSLHTLPKPLTREFRHVFGDKYLTTNDGDVAMGEAQAEILAIPTNQHARHDLVAVGDEIEAEKDRLLNCVRRQKDGSFRSVALFLMNAISDWMLFSPFRCLKSPTRRWYLFSCVHVAISIRRT